MNTNITNLLFQYQHKPTVLSTCISYHAHILRTMDPDHSRLLVPFLAMMSSARDMKEKEERDLEEAIKSSFADKDFPADRISGNPEQGAYEPLDPSLSFTFAELNSRNANMYEGYVIQDHPQRFLRVGRVSFYAPS